MSEMVALTALLSDIAGFEDASETGMGRLRVHFRNGYTLSVIRGEWSYGGADGLFECGVMVDGVMVYDTPVTSDVIGSCSPHDVEMVAREVAALPKRVAALPDAESVKELEPAPVEFEECTDGPRIYVASLTDYNAGILHGAWIDATQDADDIHADVQIMLSQSPTAKAEGTTAEEWRIDDRDEFDGVKVGEWESFENVSTLANLISEWPAVVVAHMVEDGNDVDELDDKIRDAYAGEYNGYTEEDAIADKLYDELNNRMDIPEDIGSHINAIAESMARDVVSGGEMFGVDAGNGTWHLMYSL